MIFKAKFRGILIKHPHYFATICSHEGRELAMHVFHLLEIPNLILKYGDIEIYSKENLICLHGLKGERCCYQMV